MSSKRMFWKGTEMIKTAGKTLQIVGLGLLPLGTVLELSGGLGRRFGVADLLLMLVFGASLFWFGTILAGSNQHSKSPPSPSSVEREP